MRVIPVTANNIVSTLFGENVFRVIPPDSLKLSEYTNKSISLSIFYTTSRYHHKLLYSFSFSRAPIFLK